MEIMNIRRYATDLYSIFGADSVASPRSIEERNELLMKVEDATRERISREHPHAKLSNLNDNDLVQYVQGKLTNLTALVRNAVPSNYTMARNYPAVGTRPDVWTHARAAAPFLRLNNLSQVTDQQ